MILFRDLAVGPGRGGRVAFRAVRGGVAFRFCYGTGRDWNYVAFLAQLGITVLRDSCGGSAKIELS